MNSLNLRVSSVKTGENLKKNAEVRTALITLPKIYENSEEPYCIAIKNAASIQAQVGVIKNVFQNLGNNSKALQFLTDLYFHSPLKHPVRNQILKLLITAARLGSSGIDDRSIVLALSQSIKNLMDDVKNEKESAKWNIAVASMAGCFENFECGVKALRLKLNSFFPFLCVALQKYMDELGIINSPSIRNEYYYYMHSVVRFLLSTLQEFAHILREKYPDQLRELSKICTHIIHDDEIPMDPRTNAGTVIAQTAKLFDKYEPFIQKVKNTDSVNEITLLVGVINTIGLKDFPRYAGHVLDICSKIDEVSNKYSNVPNLLLCGTRALYQVSKIILNLNLKAQTGAGDAKLILRKLMIFAFAYLEHHMDSVRHLCRDMLRNIVASAKIMQFELVLEKIFDACNSERLSLSMKCMVLQQAAQVLGAKEVTLKCPDLFTGLFNIYLGSDSIVNNLYEVLFLTSHKEQGINGWFMEWVDYLLILAGKNDDRLPEIELLIVKAVKCEPRILTKIIEHSNTQIPISTKLSALWSVRKSGFKIVDFNEIMQKFSQPLLLSVLSNSDETRLMALRLLVETHKTTEILTPIECQHLITYLEYNANCQSPATRSKSLALLGKAMVRLELNVVRTLREEREALSRQEKIFKESKHLIFLRDFMNMLVNNLFAGSNFSRRAISLNLLEKCLRICLSCNLSLNDYLPDRTVQQVTECLTDSYEANKDLAICILKLIERQADGGLIEGYQLDINVQNIKSLLLSMRPIDSVTGAYQLEFFCNRREPHEFGIDKVTIYESTTYAALCWLFYMLEDGLSLATQNLLRAAKYNPLYGILFTIKHLLKRLDFDEMAKEKLWRDYIAELLVLCKQLTAVVSPIVNNESPEGHLPNDLGDLPANLLPEDENDKITHRVLSSRTSNKYDLENVKTTPQMVLLCAWRTVKEVSLILGEIVLKSSINSIAINTNIDHLLCLQQILDIGDHFKQLLAETKHRGAFEQAYIGFSKLCCRLWCVDANELNSLPMLWLHDLMHIISSEEADEKMSATRRSAGVPFMVQALITSELQVGTAKSLFFCMAHLFEMCQMDENRFNAETRTHALNILRALFRCTDLSEAVGEYVSHGVICAIRGYDAPTWGEKNSATLLFAALMTRIFGVQRTKDSDNLNIRNKMTGHIFFIRYPRLYEFFLEELHNASQLVLKQKKANKLHPLLLILSRLYPSSLEGTECPLRVCCNYIWIS